MTEDTMDYFMMKMTNGTATSTDLTNTIRLLDWIGFDWRATHGDKETDG